MTTISLALLSHTNVGKTTLARTLLRRDIGAVMDRAHVTEVAESHVLLRSATGDELVLWDTPGFGDSVRLQRRLAASGQPIGWFLSQVWDRLADRAFWCSQQAMRAARESADVILYVVNASEDPAAGYVEPELQILDWLDKPALVLLNQIGTRTDAAQERSLVERWESALRQHDPRRPRRVLPFDAFARCWLHEHALLDAIAECVPEAARTAFSGITLAWRERDLDTLGRSADVLARAAGGDGAGRGAHSIRLAQGESGPRHAGRRERRAERGRGKRARRDARAAGRCGAREYGGTGGAAWAHRFCKRRDPAPGGCRLRDESCARCGQGRLVGRPRLRRARRPGGRRRSGRAHVRSGRAHRRHRRRAGCTQTDAALQRRTGPARRYGPLVR